MGNKKLPIEKDSTLEWMSEVALADGFFSPEEVEVFRRYSHIHGLDSEAVIEKLRRKAAGLVPSVIPVGTNVVRGFAFENIVVKQFAADSSTAIESRAADFKRGDSAIADERSLLPDLLIRQRVGAFTLRYWIECKYRSSVRFLELSEKQLRRYGEAQRDGELPVFILLGIGGKPSSPKETYLLRVNEIIGGYCGCSNGDAYTFRAEELNVRRVTLPGLPQEIKKFLL